MKRLRKQFLSLPHVLSVARPLVETVRCDRVRQVPTDAELLDAIEYLFRLQVGKDNRSVFPDMY